LDMYNFFYWFQYIMTRDLWEGKIDSNNMPTSVVHHDVYTDYLRTGAIKNFTKIYGDSVDYWKTIIAHPNLDEYWETHTVSNYVQYLSSSKKANPAVLVIGGLYDAEDCFGAFETYKKIKALSPKTDIYLAEGPWSHGAWRRDGAHKLGHIDYGPDASMDYYLSNIEYPFFAYYLEDKGTKPENEARLFDSGALKWYDMPEGWSPDAKTFTANGTTMTRQNVPFYLQPDGAISTDASYSQNATATNTEYTEYVSDPSRPVPYIGIEPHMGRTHLYMNADQRYASTRPDVAIFSTGELKEPLSIIGTPKVDFTVSISTTDADFIVKIIDVDEKGYENLIRWEVMRGKYREDLSNPMPFTPDQPTHLQFVLNDMCHTFQAGHRLMIQVQSSMFPLIDRNPQKFCNIYECDDCDFQKSTIRLWHSADHQSRIWLPVVE